MDIDTLTQWRVELALKLRLATEDDLPLLEWYGQYTHFRNLFRLTYDGQLKGERLMLVADLNQFPIGHVFMYFNAKVSLWQSMTGHKNTQSRGYLYALRVMEHLQGLGIGTRLILESERLMREQGCTSATISVAKDNPRAKLLYERLGYVVYMEDEGEWSYVDHQGRTVYVHEPCWMLEKALK